MEQEIIYSKSKENLLMAGPQKNDYYTVVLCVKGSVSIKIGYHRFELRSKMISILSPQQLFSADNASAGLSVKQLFFPKSFLQKIFLRDEVASELLQLHPDYPPVFALESSYSSVLERFEKIEKELDAKYAYYLDLARLMTLEILYEYNRACEYCLLGFEKNMNRNYQLTYQFKKLVETNFLQWRSIGEYAAHIGITAKHLTEVVKEQTGQTALQIIHERLLLECQYLLKHTGCSVKECAYQLGFETPSYFTRFFKANTGVSPLDYRSNP